MLHYPCCHVAAIPSAVTPHVRSLACTVSHEPQPWICLSQKGMNEMSCRGARSAQRGVLVMPCFARHHISAADLLLLHCRISILGLAFLVAFMTQLQAAFTRNFHYEMKDNLPVWFDWILIVTGGSSCLIWQEGLWLRHGMTLKQHPWPSCETSSRHLLCIPHLCPNLLQ